MAPKRAAAAKAAAATAPKPKANTKAKVTKPAPAAAKTKTAAPKAAANKTAAAKSAAPKAKAPAKSKAAAAATKTTKPAAEKPAARGRGRPKKATVAETEEEGETKATKPKAKATAKKATPAPKETAPATKLSRKRKAEDDAPAAAPAKKVKVQVKGAVINEPPTQRLNVYVFGEGTAGELGLGTAKNAIDVKRPRLNPNLSAKDVGVVQLAAGGMHVVALTHDNKILSWGVNDQGALGRDTNWEGGLKDIDAANDDDDSDDEEDNGLNPKESTPGEVDFSSTEIPEGTRWVQVAAGDSTSFALTDDGHVYGWGTFRSNEGIFGFSTDIHIAMRPVLIPDLKKIVSIKSGANHALALNDNGSVFAWGSGQQNQLGRRVVERTKTEGLKPREFGLPKGAKKGIVSIETGGYHSFAISKTGDVYSWGLNNFGETGIPDNAGQDDAVILKPQVVESLSGKNIISIKGGGHHSLAATAEGECLAWGRIDGHQIGIADDEIAKMSDDVLIKDENDKPRILAIPQPVTAIKGKVVHVMSSSDHNVVITSEGKAWSWGFSANYQTGQGTFDDVEVATMIDNTAVREKRLTGAETGGQFGILLAAAEDVAMVNGA